MLVFLLFSSESFSSKPITIYIMFLFFSASYIHSKFCTLTNHFFPLVIVLIISVIWLHEYHIFGQRFNHTRFMVYLKQCLLSFFVHAAVSSFIEQIMLNRTLYMLNFGERFKLFTTSIQRCPKILCSTKSHA